MESNLWINEPDPTNDLNDSEPFLTPLVQKWFRIRFLVQFNTQSCPSSVAHLAMYSS